jgi:uncharacterized protein (TIGR02145 family)
VDGNTYSTVRIGNQCWMRENLRVTHWPNGTTAVTSPTTPSLGATVAGLRYSFTDVMANTSATATSTQTQGICPVGWRVPGNADFEQLVTYANIKANASKALMSTIGWSSNVVDGQNELGMSFVPNNGTSYCELFTTEACEWDKGSTTTTESNFYKYSTSASSSKLGVRCIRANNNGENYTVNPPTVETNDASSTNIFNITVSSGSVNLYIKPGVITENDNVPPMTNLTKCGVVYSTSASSTTTLMIGKSGVSDKANTVSTQPSSYPYDIPSCYLSGLTSGTKYYYRAYAISGVDTAYGAVKYFTAQSDPNSCKAKLGSSYPETVTYDGYTYATVGLGTQCWLAENLRTTTNINSEDISGFGSISGRHYTQKGTMQGTASTTLPVRGICPLGWHVPTTAEFEALKTYMQGQSDYQCNGTSANIAKALAHTTSNWKDANTITCAPGNTPSSNNASGFNAYPAGYYYGSTQYNNGELTRFRTTTSGAVYSLRYNNPTLIAGTGYTGETNKYAVRCVYGAAAPTVATSSTAPTVSVTSATSVGGNVVNNGGSTITERGICYAPETTTTTPTISNSKVTYTAGTGSFTVNLSGLSSGVKYHYRAYATNAQGTTYGEVDTFRTKATAKVQNAGYDASSIVDPPVVYANITSASAGTITAWCFDIEESTDGGASYSHKGYYSNSTGNATGEYSKAITGLTPGGYYRFKAYVNQTIDGTLYTSWAPNYTNFRTKGPAAVTNVSASYPGGSGTGITLSANITNVGYPNYTEKGFVISTSVNPTYSSYTDKVVVSGSNTTGTFTALWDYSSEPNKTWYIRAYVRNGYSIEYSPNSTQYTTPSVPSMSFTDNYEAPYTYSSNVDKSSIKLKTYYSGGSGTLSDGGLVYTTNSSVASSAPTSLPSTTANPASTWRRVSSGTALETKMSSLSSNTTYYIRSYGTSPWGTGYSSTLKTVKTALNCGEELKDQDGHTYTTNIIGNQCWMTQNLRAESYDDTYTFGGSGRTSITLPSGGNMSATNKYRYNPNNNSSNVNNYGYLYNWAAATGYEVTNKPSGANMTTAKGYTQGVCPRGWHIPSSSELSTLNEKFGTPANRTAFNSSTTWAAGWVQYNSGATYSEFGSYLELRGYTEISSSNAVGMYLTPSGYHGTYTSSGEPKNTGMSVRCVQDISY